MAFILHIGKEDKNLLASSSKLPPIKHLPEEDAEKFLMATTELPDMLVVGPGTKKPVKWMQKAYQLDKLLPVLLISDPENFYGLKQEILYTPFIGKNIRLLNDPEPLKLISEISQSISNTRKRREFLKFKSDFNTIKPEVKISENVRFSFLNRFTDLVPIGAVLLNNDNRVVMYNKMAQRLLGEKTGLEMALFPDIFPAFLTEEIEQFLKKKMSSSVFETINEKFQTVFLELKSQAFNDALSGKSYTIIIINDVSLYKEYGKLLEDKISEKNEFISIASHELKTPLTTIKAYAQLLLKNLKADKDNYDYIKKASHHIEKLNLLIGDLLDISKIESGKLSLNKLDFDFDEFIIETIEGARQLSSSHKIIFSGETRTILYGDKFRIEQVINNFITNAIKYSPDADKVLVDINNRDGYVTVSVTDFGVGIPESAKKNIFQPFFRVEKHRLKFQGLGIGLYISSDIIARHQGKVWFKSKEGTGTTFSFSLPVKIQL